MESITFSDSVNTSEDTVLDLTTDTVAKPLSMDEYCKRNPNSVECLEYDV